MIQRASSGAMANNLKKLRRSAGWTQELAAEKLGLSLSGYEKIENSRRRLASERIAKIAEVFKVAPSEVIDDIEVEIVGTVMSGGRVEFYPQETQFRETAPRPAGSGAGMLALLVMKGATLLGIADENWLIYYEEKQVGVPDAFIGSVCLIETREGMRYVRRIFHGRDAGTYDLALGGYETIKGERIAWTAKIEWIKPR